jgi:integrase
MRTALACDQRSEAEDRQDTLRHSAISWYLAKAVDIETVSQYCGVSVATIRKTYRHVMPGTFNPILDAAHHFGR